MIGDRRSRNAQEQRGEESGRFHHLIPFHQHPPSGAIATVVPRPGVQVAVDPGFVALTTGRFRNRGHGGQRQGAQDDDDRLLGEADGDDLTKYTDCLESVLLGLQPPLEAAAGIRWRVRGGLPHPVFRRNLLRPALAIVHGEQAEAAEVAQCRAHAATGKYLASLPTGDPGGIGLLAWECPSRRPGATDRDRDSTQQLEPPGDGSHVSSVSMTALRDMTKRVLAVHVVPLLSVLMRKVGDTGQA